MINFENVFLEKHEMNVNTIFGKDPYFYRGDMLYHKKENSKACWGEALSIRCKVVEVLENIDTQKRWVTIKYETGERQKKTHTLPRGNLTPLGIRELLAYGFSYSDKKADVLCEYLMWSEHRCLRRNSFSLGHEKIGLRKYKGKWYYFGDTCDLDGVVSKYIGNEFNGGRKLNIKPKGSIESVVKMLNEEVVSQNGLSVMFLTAPSAMLSARLPTYFKENTIIDATGQSTRGKTTGGKLVVSFSSIPDENEGLFYTFFASDNSVKKFLEDGSGVCILIDESGERKKQDNSIAFSLASGVNKAVLNKERVLQATKKSFVNSVITGEESLLTPSARTGSKVRIFFLDDSWDFCRDEDSAHRIEAVINKNHGILAPDFANRLLKLTEQEILANLNDWVALLKECLVSENSGYNMRRLKKMAGLLYSAELMNEWYGTKFSKDDLANKLIDLEITSDKERHPHNEAFEKVRLFITKNQAKFEPKTRDFYGGYKTLNKVRYIAVLRNVFEKYMLELGYGDNSRKAILKKWKEQGLLYCRENDRYYSRCDIGRVKRAEVYFLAIGVLKCNPPNKIVYKLPDDYQPIDPNAELFDKMEEYFENRDRSMLLPNDEDEFKDLDF